MLEDQNDTIKKLKQNLENKIREFQQLSTEFESTQSDLRTSKSQNSTLIQEIEAQTKIIEHLHTQIDDYKLQRDDLRAQYDHTATKLRERNESILIIEAEVQRVRAIFKSKEEKLISEKDMIVAERNKEIVLLKARLEGGETWESEKVVLVSEVKSLRSRITLLDEENVRLREDLEVVLRQFEIQKRGIRDKMQRMKALVAD
ncbi:hypothetical protein HK096_011511 [Nowakowskiella sp. JEL0078]|nr:hypothetical protein HK096_011511 [Nowakowskiella sp. JEL0078]